MIRRDRTARVLGVALLLMLRAGLAFAVASEASPAPPSPVGGESVAPHPPAPQVEARKLKGPSASQAWDFVARFESGHFLFVRFLVTNVGPGERNAAAIWHLVDPDGEVHEFHNGRRSGNWSLEDSGHRLLVGSSVLTLRGAQQGVLIDKKKVRINLGFSLPSQVIDEVITPTQRLVLVSFATPVEATLWHSEMGIPLETSGFAAISLTQEESAQAALQRVEFISLDPQDPFFASQVLDEAGRREAWAWISRGDRIIRTRRLTVCDMPRSDPYPAPRRMLVSDHGLRVEVAVETPFLRYDPLSALPKTFQTVLAWFYTPQRLWAWGSFVTDETRERKRGLARFTFNSSLSASLIEALDEAPECRPASAS